jgi:hypothetical protein
MNTPGATTYSHGRILCAVAAEVPPARIAATIVRPLGMVVIIALRTYTHASWTQTPVRIRGLVSRADILH